MWLPPAPGIVLDRNHQFSLSLQHTGNQLRTGAAATQAASRDQLQENMMNSASAVGRTAVFLARQEWRGRLSANASARGSYYRGRSSGNRAWLRPPQGPRTVVAGSTTLRPGPGVPVASGDVDMERGSHSAEASSSTAAAPEPASLWGSYLVGANRDNWEADKAKADAKGKGRGRGHRSVDAPRTRRPRSRSRPRIAPLGAAEFDVGAMNPDEVRWSAGPHTEDQIATAAQEREDNLQDLAYAALQPELGGVGHDRRRHPALSVREVRHDDAGLGAPHLHRDLGLHRLWTPPAGEAERRHRIDGTR